MAVDLDALLHSSGWGGTCRATTRQGRKCRNRATLRGLVCATHIDPAWTFGDWLAIYAYAVRPLVRDGIAWGDLPPTRGLNLRCPIQWGNPRKAGSLSVTLCTTWTAYPSMPVVSGAPFVDLVFGRTRAQAPVPEALVSVDAALATGRIREDCPAAVRLLERLHQLAAEAATVRVGETLAGLSFSSWERP